MMKGIISALVATGLSVSSSASPSRSHVYVLPTKAQVLISQPASAHVYIKWIVGRGNSRVFRFSPRGPDLYSVYLGCAGPGSVQFKYGVRASTGCGRGSIMTFSSSYPLSAMKSGITFRIFASPSIRWEFQVDAGRAVSALPGF